MKILRTTVLFLLVASVGGAFAQSWSAAYDQGLRAARAQQWAEAREAFLQAAAYRPDDVSGATTLPGPVTEQRRWRGGSPYSPNFLAAYAGYREALTVTAAQAQSAQFRAVAEELELLLQKGQTSREAIFFLDRIYAHLGEGEKRRALEARYAEAAARAAFRVDTEIVDPQELAAMAPITGTTTGPEIIRPGAATTIIPAANVNVPPPGAVGGVTPVESKFALVIGNGESRLPGGGVAYAADDAQRVREALLMNAGYPEQNIDIVLNATAAQIASSARALAERMPQDATVLIYFAGNGANVDGRDFLAGVDTDLASDTASMIAKNDLYRTFMSRGAQIFAFYQVPRPIVAGRFFGMEVPLAGTIAQVQATLPGETVHGMVRDGRNVGLFTNAFTRVLTEMRSNAIPISEFGWQVFYKMRRGESGSIGVGSIQTPTLPVLTHMGSEARF
jgi:hypothetical protein